MLASINDNIRGGHYNIEIAIGDDHHPGTDGFLEYRSLVNPIRWATTPPLRGGTLPVMLRELARSKPGQVVVACVKLFSHGVGEPGVVPYGVAREDKRSLSEPAMVGWTILLIIIEKWFKRNINRKKCKTVMLTKSRLAILLSKQKDFERPKANLEQYTTDSETAARILWNAHMLGDIENKVVADLGCGTGILGIGCLLLGAQWVHLLDADKKAIEIAKANLSGLEEYNIAKRAHFIVKDVSDFEIKVDTVIQNPPFGVQRLNADRAFLEKAMECTETIHSIHKIESEGFVKALCKEKGFIVSHLWHYSLPLKQTMAYHTHRIQRINVGCWRLIKKKTI
ncbi:METTL5 family protein [Candidatus Woesearchaeota archaeon]|nr:METTL5 family protein [Candidatus Woesearchaeota archaeon]